MPGKNRKLRGAIATQPPNRIAELRSSLGLSQTDLAHRCHMGKSSIARIENGETGMDLADMRIIARALHAKPSELMVKDDVEVRLDVAARSSLEGLGPDEINMVMQAAATIAKLVKRLSPQGGASTLTGDPATSSKMADLWNEMSVSEQSRALGLLETARSFRYDTPVMAAE
jgi:transcriptional regulator with XRE-family HTH domain